MYNNQDILKKHTSLTIRRKDVSTSFIMFPVRLETRFVDNHYVEDISEPDRALYAFQALWNYVWSLDNMPSLTDGYARQVLVKIENLDTVYREDKSRLRSIVKEIVAALSPEGEMKELWTRVQDHIERLTTLDVVNDNEATVFLRELDRVNRIVHNMREKPSFAGLSRVLFTNRYSETMKISVARKRMKECLPVLEQLLPENPADTILNRFPFITEKQFKKFEKSLSFFYITKDQLNQIYGYIKILEEEAGKKMSYKVKEQILGALDTDFESYETYRDRFLGKKDDKGQEVLKSRRQSLVDKMRSKIGQYNHYTLFAEKMIMWKLRLSTGRKQDIATTARVETWRSIADNTIFSFHEEREWLISVLKRFNDYKENHNPSQMISCSRLNRHTKSIRPRKLCYRKKMKCLLVRIYPDEIAVTQMSKPLTQMELVHASTFWTRYFYYENDLTQQKSAWEALCALYTPPRAAVIARSFFSGDNKSYPLTTFKSKILKAKRDKLPLDKMIYAMAEITKKDICPGFTLAKDNEDLFPVPVSELMPDRFILQANLNNGAKKGLTIVQYGRLVPKTIQVGVDLNNEPAVSSSKQGPKFGGNLRWMTDYDAAERMGMAITLPLDPYKFDHYTKKQKKDAKKKGIKLPEKPLRTFHFNSIYVMGVKEFSKNNKEDSDACTELLTKVFNAHLYSDEGLDLLKIGTPTNILTDEDVETSKKGRDAENSDYDTEEKALVAEFFEKSIKPFVNGIREPLSIGDARVLSSLFRMYDHDHPENNPFYNVVGRDNVEVAKAQHVNAAFLEVLKESHPILKLIANSKRLKAYFSDSVVPTGVYPPFRIGNQPYGIMPVCDFRNIKYNPADPLQTLKEILIVLTEKWNDIARTKVLSEANIHGQKNLSAEQSYLKAVSATPLSTSFYSRSEVNEPDLLTARYFRGQKNGADPLTNIYNIVIKLSPLMSKPGFIKRFFPKFASIPIRDSEYVAFRQNFTWGNLKKKIVEKLKGYDVFKGVSDAEYESLITGTFDLFNYRLDAWLTGLLDYRMRGLRKTSKNKIALGAYGWVFNLKENRDEPVSDEYIVAPSVNQAITAAVLRSSFNRAAEGRSKDYSLSVNLSSSRVRQALRVIHGIRNGLSLGTILGSDLERLLHDDYKKQGGYEMDYFIFFLRKAYPLNNTASQYSAGSGVKRDPSLDVLNGVALLEDLRGGEWIDPDDAEVGKSQLTTLYNTANPKSRFNLESWLLKIFGKKNIDDVKKLFVINGKDYYTSKVNRVILLIQRMEDTYDALADVVTSESVYKLTEGNRVAVDALMNSLNTGRNIPVPDVTEIPLDSAHIEERVFAALDSEAVSQCAESYFSQIEPALDKWMGQMLGFDELEFQFTEGDAAVNVSLGNNGLGISPSELVYLSTDWEKFRKFLSLKYWSSKAAPSKGLGIFLDEAEMAVDSMREMLLRARPLKQEDLIVNTESPEERFIDSALLKRLFASASKIHSDLKNELSKLMVETDEFFKEDPNAPLPELLFRRIVAVLLKCFRLGITDAISAVDPSMLVYENERFDHPTEFADILSRQHSLTQHLANNYAILEEKWKKAEDASRQSYEDAFKAFLIPSFIVVPHFMVENNGAIDTNALVMQSADKHFFNNVTKSVIEDNLMGLSDVRQQMAALHQVRLFGKYNYLDAAREVSVMQLESEYHSDRSWMGAEVKNEENVRDANVYTILNPSQFIVNNGKSLKYVAGLLIDYWVERIPYKRQTAAVAFGYDQPDAEPPQAILVGVSTLGGNHYWSEKRMLRTIHSAMHQIKSRAVEPEMLYSDKWTSGLFPLLQIDPNDTLK